MPSFRHRLEQSAWLAGMFGWLAYSYLRLCHATTRWQVEGLRDLQADLADGPVLLVTWHERMLMAPSHWPLHRGQFSCLSANSPIGRVGGAMSRHFGHLPVEMADHASNRAASRAVLKRVHQGISIGITADGPRGPALVVKDAPLDWARIMQRPVYAFAFAAIRHRRINAWDRMVIPLPFTRGAAVFQRWRIAPPRKADAAQVEDLRQQMAALLDTATARADHLAAP